MKHPQIKYIMIPSIYIINWLKGDHKIFIVRRVGESTLPCVRPLISGASNALSHFEKASTA